MSPQLPHTPFVLLGVVSIRLHRAAWNQGPDMQLRSIPVAQAQLPLPSPQNERWFPPSQGLFPMVHPTPLNCYLPGAMDKGCSSGLQQEEEVAASSEFPPLHHPLRKAGGELRSPCFCIV